MITIPEHLIHRIRLKARYGVTYGRDQTPHERAYYRSCTHFHPHTGTTLIFTRDAGHHTSGWMKNPDYERCLHLSVSFREPSPEISVQMLKGCNVITPAPVPFNRPIALQWARSVLYGAVHLSWEEGAFTREGRALSVTHWRVFCDPSWEPLKPRAEVYTKDFTEKGWRSWSELQLAPNWVDAS